MQKKFSATTTARLAGLFYLIMGIGTGYSIMGVDRKIYTPGDIPTIDHILASAGLIRLGFISNLVGLLGFIMLAFTLYHLFKPVNEKLAGLMTALILISIPISFINMINPLMPLFLLNGNTAFSSEQLQSLSMLFLDLHEKGIHIAGIFWGLWLLPLGLLVIFSHVIPKILGVLLILGGLGYFSSSIANLIFPNYKMIVSIGPSIGGIAEILFLLWLLIRGVNIKKWEERYPL